MSIDNTEILAALYEAEDSFRRITTELHDHRDEIDLYLAVRLAPLLSSHVESVISVGDEVCSQFWDDRMIENTEKRYEWVATSRTRAILDIVWARFFEGREGLRAASSSYGRVSDALLIPRNRK